MTHTIAHDSLLFDTPLGTLEIAAHHGAITFLIPVKGEVPTQQQATPQHALLTTAAAEVVAFLEGRLQHFSVPVAPRGTEFQESVWQELQRIPYGETISYRELATRAGKPLAVRTIGSICGANPVPLIIPCHRVLRSNGDLGGFGWGLEVKAWLLDNEEAWRQQKVA